MMKHDQESIQSLMTQTDVDIRERMYAEFDLGKKLRDAKGILDEFHLTFDNWAKAKLRVKYIHYIGGEVHEIFCKIDRTLAVRAAALEAQEILSAGFEFDRISIDGILFQRVDNGFTESGASDDRDHGMPDTTEIFCCNRHGNITL